MKVLFIGGTGNISTAASRLAVERGMELHLLNRGTRRVAIPGARTIAADIGQETAAPGRRLGPNEKLNLACPNPATSQERACSVIRLPLRRMRNRTLPFQSW